MDFFNSCDLKALQSAGIGSASIDKTGWQAPLGDRPSATSQLLDGTIASLGRSSAIASAAAPLLVVTSTADTINANDNVLTLREAIQAANDRPGLDTITFDAIAFAGAQTITLTAGQLIINDSLLLQGTGVNRLTISGDANQNGILDAGDKRLFFVNQGSVELRDLRLAQGGAGSDGAGGGAGMSGALFINGGTVSLNTVNVQNNRAIGGAGGTVAPLSRGGGGGGFGSGGGGSAGSGGSFAGNGGKGNALENITRDGGGGGGGAGLGGAIFVRSGSLTVTNTTFRDNTATGGLGGRAFRDGEAGTNGQGKGGAIFVHQGAIANFTSSVSFTNNTAADASSSSTDNGNLFGAAQPVFTIANLAKLEGNSGDTAFEFTVQLSAPVSDRSITVNYATADGTATAGNDYHALNGQLTFAPNETQKTIRVLVKGDTLNETN